MILVIRAMKRFAVYFLFLLPCMAFGQLFPKVPDFRGNVRQVTEKRYGREIPGLRKTDGKYRPGAFSGWTFTYVFDRNSRLITRTEAFNNHIESRKRYTYKIDGSRKIVRQTETSNASNAKGDFQETEITTGSDGQVSEVNYLGFDAKTGKTSLYMLENSARYSDGKLTGFKRIQFGEKEDTASVEACNLIYDNRGRLSGIRRADAESGFSTVIDIHYNLRGCVDRYSVDLLAELQEIGQKQLQDIYYRYDRHGNWKKMYRGTGRSKQLEARRKNKYW